MNWPYSFTLSSWVLTGVTVFLLALGWVAWRNRQIAGALAFAFCLLFTAIWGMGALFHSAAVNTPTQILWTKFQTIWQMPQATAYTCFVLEYARPGRWLTRRIVALLALPALLVAVVAFTNDLHHWLWAGFDASGTPVYGPADRIFTAVALVLLAVNLVAFAWLFMRSPQHRWPVALMVVGQLWGRAYFVLDRFGVNVSGQLEPFIFISAVPVGIYTLALFGFRIFDPMPAARAAAIEEMSEGMVVTDLEGNVLYLNPTAEKILGAPMNRLRGRNVDLVLQAADTLGDQPEEEIEISLGSGESTRHFVLRSSPLSDRRGVALGRLLLLQDITLRRKAQAELLEQHKVVSALRERQQLARELHDSLGQVLAYISMQAQAIRKRVHDGQTDSIEAQLAQLAEAAQSAHQDIRASILNLKTGPAERWSFFPALQAHLAAYEQQYGIRAELSIPETMTENDFQPGAGVQLLRVIQEALTNARTHGDARKVKVSFAADDGQLCTLITDDGCGFDPNAVGQVGHGHFGLDFMRERMAFISGQMDIDSAPGAGTSIVLRIPLADSTREASQ